MKLLSAQLQHKLITIVRHKLHYNYQRKLTTHYRTYTTHRRVHSCNNKKLHNRMKMISYHEQLMHYVHSSLSMSDGQNTFNAKATIALSCVTRKWVTDRSRHNCLVKICDFSSPSHFGQCIEVLSRQ